MFLVILEYNSSSSINISFMEPLDLSSPADREIAAFFDKTRTVSQNLMISQDESRLPRRFLTISQQPESRVFGAITKKEIEEILEAYDKQKAQRGAVVEPVKCDKILGQSYAKLLHSKPGFHHPGSTVYLARKLGISNAYPDSLLGGYSSYSVGSSEDLPALRSRHRSSMIKTLTQRFHQSLEKDDKEVALLEYDRICKIDPNNSNARACRGLISWKEKKYIEAVDDLRAAIKGDIEFKDLIKNTLVTCLYEIGCLKYQTRNYTQAISAFDEALTYNPNHDGVKLHRRMSREGLNSRSRFSTVEDYNRPRK